MFDSQGCIKNHNSWKDTRIWKKELTKTSNLSNRDCDWGSLDLRFICGQFLEKASHKSYQYRITDCWTDDKIHETVLCITSSNVNENQWKYLISRLSCIILPHVRN